MSAEHPAPSQLEAARALLTRMSEWRLFDQYPAEADALRTLLAATAPPTSADLEAEARAWYERLPMFSDTPPTSAYIAGARREGAR
jgi:hypothetical protein